MAEDGMQMNHDARLRQYHTTQVRTADRGKLLLMVYDAAIGSLRECQQHMKDGALAAKGIQMDRAIRAVGELRSSLNMEEGREIARSLDQLYEFIHGRMREANLSNQPQELEVVLRILEDLRETWTQVIRREESEEVTAGGKTYQI